MIEILTMQGQVIRRYVIDADRFEPAWRDLHHSYARTLLDQPTARIAPGVPNAPYLEYSAQLPAWADHPDLAANKWIVAYAELASVRPVYVGAVIPSDASPVAVSGALAMVATLTSGTPNGGEYLLADVEAARPDSIFVGGYTPAIQTVADPEWLSRFLSESAACLALQMLAIGWGE